MKNLLVFFLSAQALAYQTNLDASNKAEALERCHGLLGKTAYLSNVSDAIAFGHGKEGPIAHHYVKAVCAAPDLSDTGAAEQIASTIPKADDHHIALAVVKLKDLGIYNERIIRDAVKGLGTSYVPGAQDLMYFLSEGKALAIRFVVPRLSDEDPSVRYQAAHTLYLLAYEGQSAALRPYLEEFARRYSLEQNDNAFMNPYPLGVKINLARVFGFVGPLPAELLDRVLSDLGDWELSHEYVHPYYEGTDRLGNAIVQMVGQLGASAAPALGELLYKHSGGPYVNGESFSLLAAEALGANGKSLIPVLKRILAEGQSPYPARVQKTLTALE